MFRFKKVLIATKRKEKYMMQTINDKLCQTTFR